MKKEFDRMRISSKSLKKKNCQKRGHEFHYEQNKPDAAHTKKTASKTFVVCSFTVTN